MYVLRCSGIRFFVCIQYIRHSRVSTGAHQEYCTLGVSSAEKACLSDVIDIRRSITVQIRNDETIVHDGFCLKWLLSAIATQALPSSTAIIANHSMSRTGAGASRAARIPWGKAGEIVDAKDSK